MYAVLLFAMLQVPTQTPNPTLPQPPVEHGRPAKAPQADPATPPAQAPAKPGPQPDGKQPAAAPFPAPPPQDHKAAELTELEKLRVDNATLRAVVFQLQAKEQQNALLEQRSAIVKTVEASHPGSHVTQDPRTGETLLEADKPAQTDKPPLPDKPK